MSFNEDYVAEYFNEAGRLILSNNVLTEVTRIYNDYPAILPVIFRVVKAELDFGGGQYPVKNIHKAKLLAENKTIFANNVAKRIMALDEGHRTYIPAVIWSRGNKPISYESAVTFFEEHRDRKINYGTDAENLAWPYCQVGLGTVEILPEIADLLSIDQQSSNPQLTLSSRFIRENKKIDTHLLN